MFNVNDRVMVLETEEFPAPKTSDNGWVLKQFKRYPEFYLVLLSSGFQIVAHVSQLVKREVL